MRVRVLLLWLYLVWVPDCLWAATKAISPPTFKTLKQAEKLLDQKAYTQALVGLKDRLKKTNEPLEQALLLRAIASAYVMTGNNRQAASYLEKALTLNALPEMQTHQAQLSLAQLYMVLDKPAQAAALLEKWMRTVPEIRPPEHVLIAQIFTRLEHYRRALKHLDQAIEQTGTPQEPWLQLRLALNFQLKNFGAAITDLKTLLRLHPQTKRYWQQLAGLYQLSKQTLSAAAAMQLEDFLGFLDQEQEILNSISLLRMINAPFLAASRLQQAIEKKQIARTPKHLDLLANIWIEAREFDHAIRTLEQAATLNPKGPKWFRLAQLYLERENWSKAAAALNKALERGGLKKPGEAWLLLGNVYFEQNNFIQAQNAFGQAARFPSTRKSATQWLTYLKHLHSTP